MFRGFKCLGVQHRQVLLSVENSHFIRQGSNSSVALEHIKEKQPTLLNLCIIDTQAKQWWSLAPQQSDITGGQVQLEDRRIHVLSPKYEITIMRDSEWMVQLFSIVHHL